VVAGAIVGKVFGFNTQRNGGGQARVAARVRVVLRLADGLLTQTTGEPMRITAAPLRSVRSLALTASCAALLSSGCATIAQGRYQSIHVETNPPAARVSVTGPLRKTKGAALEFSTPGFVVLHRKERRVVLRIDKDGYEPVEVALKRSASGWTPFGAASLLGVGAAASIEGSAAAALAIGGIYAGISVGIDLATGAAYRLSPADVSLTLQPKPGLSEWDDGEPAMRSSPAAALQRGR
jgi:hypothetical protein